MKLLMRSRTQWKVIFQRDEEDGSMEFEMGTTNMDIIKKFVSELNVIVAEYVKNNK